MPNQLTKLMLAGILSCGACGAVYATEAQTAQAPAQTVTCTGTVYDSTGEPVIGASVIVKGAGTGAATNIDGEFSLKGVKIGDEITVTYIGCDPYTFKVTGSEPVSITLKENAHDLDEVVVTALGMKREKKALGYAVTELKGDELNTNLVNPVSALQGKVAGVNINQSDGGLFGHNKIEIRGASTLSKNNQPIYVVDGIILDNDQQDKEGDWDANNFDYGNELKNLNPADFETVSVLKGAAATALYGSRGLNGVVVITTKSGKGAKGYGVTVSQTLGCDWISQSPHFNNTYGMGDVPGVVGYGEDSWYNYLALNADGKPSIKATKALTGNYGYGVPYSEYEGQLVEYLDGSYRPYRAYKDNYKNAYRTGFNTNTNVAVTGGNEKTTFYMSAGYKYAQGVVEENDFKRFSFMLKASHQVSKTVNVEGGVTFANSTPRNAAINMGEYFTSLSPQMVPWIDVKSEKNNYRGSTGGLPIPGDDNYYNTSNALWWRLFENNYQRKETVVRPNLKVTVTPFDWMRLTAEGSMNYYYVRGEEKEYGTGSGGSGGYYGLSQSNKEQTNLNINMNLNKEWGDFETHAMLRGEYFHSFVQAMSMHTNGGLINYNKFFINNSKNPISYSGYINGKKTMWSAMAQVGASWKGQLYLDVTGRNDWSSTLLYSDGHGTYSYFYPSVSASWLADNTFREYLPWWVSMAKFRASWAQVGNDTDPYGINNAYSYVGSTHNGTNNAIVTPPSSATDLNLKPERKTSWEFGLDWRFVNNRFGLDFTYYKENTKDQIMSISVPSVSGISSKKINAGNIQNSGIEIALNATPIETKDWTWDLTFTFTRNRSKIVELHPDAGRYIVLSGDPEYGNYRIGSVATVGGAYGTLMTDISPLVDEESGKKVLYWMSSYKGASYRTDPTVKAIGDINPKFLAGVSTGLRWKDLRLNVALDGRWGGYVAAYNNRYGNCIGVTEASLQYRDAAHGGAKFTSMWNGKTYNDGVIPDGIFPTGSKISQPNDAPDYVVGAGKYGSGETFQELMDKGVIEPIHAGTWHFLSNYWNQKNAAFGAVNDSWYTKLNYVALREVSLSYSLPAKIASKLGSKGINLTATGHNLCYLHNSLPNKINPESVRGTNSHEFRIRSFEGTTASFTFTINAQF